MPPPGSTSRFPGGLRAYGGGFASPLARLQVANREDVAISPEQIALSASHAAWLGALASASASIIALSIAIFGARRDEVRRRRLARDQETAFCFAMVGALEMIKPIILHMVAAPEVGFDRRRFIRMVEHARTIAQAGLSIQVLDMQLLSDAYHLWGAINYLWDLSESHEGPLSHTAIAELIGASLQDLLAADDRFFARLPSTSDISGISGRTPVPEPT